jgi:serine/threonine protein kinase
VADSCDPSKQWLNGEWLYAGKTADDRPYYAWWDADGGMWFYIYYDTDCDGKGGILDRWHVDNNPPDTSAQQDLDGDGACVQSGSVQSPAPLSVSLTPPSTTWQIFCNNGKTATFVAFDLTITPDCATTFDYVYSWGEWTPQQPVGTACSALEYRIAKQTCNAAPGCCINEQPNVQTRAKTTPLCVTDGAVPNFVVSWVTMPDACMNPNLLIGEWLYAGRTLHESAGITAPGKPYYARWNAVTNTWAYIYYDKNCFGKDSSTSLDHRWFLDYTPPSTTALENLDGDDECVIIGFTKLSALLSVSLHYTLGFLSLTPPSSATWQVFCNGTFTSVDLTITPDCPTTPDYTYGDWSEWTATDSGQRDGTGCTALEQRVATQTCSGNFGCCINEQPIAQVRKNPVCAANGEYPSFTMNGVPDTCKTEGWFNGEWLYAGKTADDRPYYAWWDADVGVWYYMYFDKDCGIGHLLLNRWYIRTAPPNTTAVQNLDGIEGNQCKVNGGFTLRSSTSTLSLTPPSTTWQILCNGTFTALDLTIAPDCELTPDYTYGSWSEWKPQQTDDSVCGGVDARFARASCTGRLGCCVNEQPSVQYRAQPLCTTDGAFPNFTLEGVPDSCKNEGWLNGYWRYVGKTADDRPYYAWWDENSKEWYYIYFDTVCDGSVKEFSKVSEMNWILTTSKPSITALQDLAGNNACICNGATLLPTISSTPPSAIWEVTCGINNFESLSLTIAPDCDSTPDFTYSWGEWTPQQQTDGIACGGSDRRLATEECSVGPGCCISVQPTVQTRGQPLCTTDLNYPRLALSGVPNACYRKGWLNGEWQYAGRTADDRPYYARLDAQVGRWYYMHYDKACDDMVGGEGTQVWVIDNTKPSTNALQDLDGDGGCRVIGYTVLPTASRTPPVAALWNMDCLGVSTNPFLKIAQPPSDNYASVVLSGLADTCSNRGNYQGKWDYAGRTADFRPYYMYQTSTSKLYLYFDSDCSGTGSFKEAWVIKDTQPSLTALKDLDGDRLCSVEGFTARAGRSFTPPFEAEWTIDCGSNNGISFDLTILPECATTPDYTYTWGEWMPEQPDGTVCGDLDQRGATEECSGAPGCCIHQQKNPQRRLQPPCLTDGEYSNILVNGVPESCYNGQFNGEWRYLGKTADGRPHYKWWYDAFGVWRYLYYDEIGCFGNGTSEKSGWYMDDQEPSTTALKHLNGDLDCKFGASTVFSTLEGNSMTPPSGLEWNVQCKDGSGDKFIPFTLEIASLPSGDFANFSLSGVPDACSLSHFYNGRWAYVGRTPNFRPHYKLVVPDSDDEVEDEDDDYSWWMSNELIGEKKSLPKNHFLYYVSDCSALSQEIWAIGSFDDQDCFFKGFELQQTFRSFAPPSSATWNIHCNSTSTPFISFDLTISPDCATTPDYTYTWGEWMPEQTDGTVCGELDQRVATEECSAAPGCCINQQPNPQRRPQPSCLTDEDYTNLVLSGVPESCKDGNLNGVWRYVKKTSDAHPYYKWWHDGMGAWRYLYYDHMVCINLGANGSPTNKYGWFIGDSKPNTTALNTIDGDAICTYLAEFNLALGKVGSSIMTPPSGVVWNVDCAGSWISTVLDFTPEYPNFKFAGVPQLCLNAIYVGEYAWIYAGNTADDRPYYRRWFHPLAEWRYLLHRDGFWVISSERTAASRVGSLTTPTTSVTPFSGMWTLETCGKVLYDSTGESISVFPLEVVYPNVVMGGAIDSCLGGAYTGEWTYIGVTVDGRPYYKKAFSAWQWWMYYDRDCDGEDGAEFVNAPIWQIHLQPPSIIATEDLDAQDGRCADFIGRTHVSSASFTPPTSASWLLVCFDYDNKVMMDVDIVTAPPVVNEEERNWKSCAEQEGAICFCDGFVLYGQKYAEDGRIATYDTMINRPHQFKKMAEGNIAVPCTETAVTDNTAITLPYTEVPRHCICLRSAYNVISNVTQNVPPFLFRSNGSYCNVTNDAATLPPRPCDSAHVVLYFDGSALFEPSSVMVEEVERTGATLLCPDEYAFSVPFYFQSKYEVRDITFNVLVQGGNVSLFRTEMSPVPNEDELRAIANINIPIVCAIGLPQAATVPLDRGIDGIGTWMNLCETILKPNVTHNYTFGPENNSQETNFDRDSCTLAIKPCVFEDIYEAEKGPCYNNIPTITTELPLTEFISGVRGILVEIGSLGKNRADDCTAIPLHAEMAKYGIGNHYKWDQQVGNHAPVQLHKELAGHGFSDPNVWDQKGHAGITVFGTPDVILYGGCEAGVDFGMFEVAIRETEVPESGNLRVQCAQSAATETVVYDFNKIEVLVFRATTKKTATTKQTANIAATDSGKKSSKRGAALGATLVILAIIGIGVAVWVIRKRGTKQSSTEEQITELIVKGSVTLVASAFAHMFVQDDETTSAQPNQRQAAAEHMHSWLADHQVSKRAIVCGDILGDDGIQNRETRRGKLRLKAARTVGKSDVVVQICNLSELDGNQRVIKQFCAEALLVGGLQHPNILCIRYVVTNSLPFMVVTDWMEGGDLQLYLRSCRSTIKSCREVLRVKELITIAFQIVLACEFLEAHKMIHRALMSSNVLVGENHLDIRLTGFGSLREVLRSEEYVKTSDKKDTQLNIRFMAPESFTDNRFSIKSDVWAFGVTVWEVLSFARKPYGNFHPSEIAKEVRSLRRLEPVDGCPEELTAAMQQCWLVDPASRPTFASLQGTLRLLLLEDAAGLRAKVTAATKLTERTHALDATLNLPMRGWSNVGDDPDASAEVMFALSCVSGAHPDLTISELRQAAGPVDVGRRVAISSTSMAGTAQLQTAVAMRCELAHHNLVPFLGTTHSIAGGFAAVFGAIRTTRLLSTMLPSLGRGSGSEFNDGGTDVLASQLALQMAMGIEYVHAKECVYGARFQTEFCTRGCHWIPRMFA